MNPVVPLSPPPFRIIAIVDSTAGTEEAIEEASLHPGIGFGVMLRDRLHRNHRVAELARHAVELILPPNVQLISNGVAIDGIAYLHLPSKSLYDVTSSQSLPGYSIHSLEEERLASSRGGGYLLYSPIFPTWSKPGHPGAGIAGLRELCETAQLPLFALGGIDHRNVSACLDAGAYGIASISLFGVTARRSLRETLEIMRSRAEGVER